MKLAHILAISALAIGGSLGAAPTGSSSAITAAVADPVRPAEDISRDVARKPAAILAFAQVEPGDKVADFIMGGGYFTRLLAKAVGPSGRVYAYQPAEFIQYKAKYGQDQKTVASAYPNVTPLRQPLASVAFPEPLDVAITAQNYHDLHLASFPADTAAKVNAALFRALKPGGVLLVIDHVAASGSGLRDAEKLHRIDPAAARAEIEKAGFRFEAESPILRNPADPHNASVFDAAIQGKTDQFVYRFRKPR